jgi:hypothetical protein
VAPRPGRADGCRVCRRRHQPGSSARHGRGGHVGVPLTTTPSADVADVAEAAGVATVTGGYDDEVQREVVAVLARTVPGVAAIKLVTSVAT